MEVESKAYSVRFENGDTVLLDQEVLENFATLKNMVNDFGEDMPTTSTGYIIIPLYVEGITAPMLQRMVDFYTLPREENEIIFEENEQEVVALINAADYLESTTMLVFLIDLIYASLQEKDTSELEKRFLTLPKRKAEPEELEVRPIRRHYRRMWLLNAIASSLLPRTLVRGMDQRIEKYAELIAHSRHLTVIRQGTNNPSVFIREEAATPDVMEVTGILSLARGKQRLYTDIANIVEVVVGDLFIGVLTKEGNLSLYGEYLFPYGIQYPGTSYIRHSDAIRNQEDANRVSLDDECFGLWSGGSFGLALTKNALVMFGFHNNPRNYPKSQMLVVVNSDPAWLATIVQISCGDRHALILTTKGLYGLGSNLENQFGFQVKAMFFEEPILIEAISDNRNIGRIFCASSYSAVVTKDAKLYVSGFSRSYETGRKPWREYPLGKYVDNEHPIKLLAGGSYFMYVVIGESIYKLLSSDTIFPAFSLPGSTIIEIKADRNDYLIVATTTALYLEEANRDVVYSFGGTSSSSTSPYKLLLAFNVEEKERQESNKKRRLDCHYCSAKALFTDKKRELALCSRYCLYKSRLTQ